MKNIIKKYNDMDRPLFYLIIYPLSFVLWWASKESLSSAFVFASVFTLLFFVLLKLLKRRGDKG
jgi:hypothetical protein